MTFCLLAKFYCFKINGINEMVFRTNQKNTTYRSVAASDEGGNLITSCDKTAFDYFEAGGLATLKVRKDGDRYEPKCGETKVFCAKNTRSASLKLIQ